MARRDDVGVRLTTRNGNDFANRFPIIVAAVTALPARSFLIDGEAIVTNGDGFAVFELVRHKRHGGAAVLCAFDLIDLDGEDLRRSSIEYRKRKLTKLLRGPNSASCSMSTTRAMARAFLTTPASAATRASYRPARLDLSLRALAAQDQEPSCASRREVRRLGQQGWSHARR
jgi:ATP-dependent DNA ligase